jgi:hypothetical protein
MTETKKKLNSILQQAEQNIYDIQQMTIIELQAIQNQGVNASDFLRYQEQQRRLSKIIELADNALEHIRNAHRARVEN